MVNVKLKIEGKMKKIKKLKILDDRKISIHLTQDELLVKINEMVDVINNLIQLIQVRK
jgi:hypothetical protein